MLFCNHFTWTAGRAAGLFVGLAGAWGHAFAALPAEHAGDPVARVIEAHRRFLADDLLEGRGTGERGHEIAAQYVAAQFAAHGLRPAGDGGTYWQGLSLLAARADQAAAALVVHGAEEAVALEPENDVLVRPAYLGGAVEVRAPAIFLGFGIQAPEFGHDDLTGVDLKGRIAVVLSGAPRHFPATARAHFSRRKADAIEALGAVGLVVLTTPEEAARAPWAVTMAQSRFERMRLLAADGSVVDGLLGLRATATVRVGAGAPLFEGAPVTLEEVHAAATRGEAPVFPLAVEVTLRGAATERRTTSGNVLGLLPGTDPALADRPVVLTSHLDHLGIGPEVDGDTIYNGAFDNAIGIAMMLHLAERLAAEGPFARPILFAAVTAEEKGLLGSTHLARNPPAGVSRFAANVNIDMTLLLAPVREVIGRGDVHSTLGAVLQAAAARTGFTVAEDPRPEEVIFVRSDQYSFVRQGVPALYLAAGLTSTDPAIDLGALERQFRRQHYHKPSDDLSLPVDWPSVTAFAGLVGEVLRAVGSDPVDPVWLKDDFFGRTYQGPMAE